jgi:hypothetical protein
MKNSFNSAVKDPFVRDLLKFAAVVAAAIVAVIGFKTLRNYFKKR